MKLIVRRRRASHTHCAVVRHVHFLDGDVTNIISLLVSERSACHLNGSLFNQSDAENEVGIRNKNNRTPWMRRRKGREEMRTTWRAVRIWMTATNLTCRTCWGFGVASGDALQSLRHMHEDIYFLFDFEADFPGTPSEPLFRSTDEMLPRFV